MDVEHVRETFLAPGNQVLSTWQLEENANMVDGWKWMSLASGHHRIMDAAQMGLS
jgi:hypothetical protein